MLLLILLELQKNCKFFYKINRVLSIGKTRFKKNKTIF
jgi:hypothetical protein